MRPLWLIILLLHVSSAAADSAYTWIEEGGVRHFSDHPPNAQQTEMRILRPAPSPGASQARMDKEAQRAAAEQRRFEAILRRDAAREEQARRQRCVGLKEQLGLLEQRTKLRTTDTDGAQQVLDESARQTLIRDTQARLRVSCAY